VNLEAQSPVRICGLGFFLTAIVVLRAVPDSYSDLKINLRLARRLRCKLLIWNVDDSSTCRTVQAVGMIS